ncbi:hypothetical protein AVEN_193184-1 [Araneus ventricosus]|uniref:Uncharacterized protein n=1 Tax=Araneus ventricosus TaxID=182803 RepID=A0A4Y2B1M1_ARAVE|nr:hypothetical protein AVEN_193184-1 [Araneus ventricosus]
MPVSFFFIVPNKSRPPHAGGGLPTGPLPALHPFWVGRASVVTPVVTKVLAAVRTLDRFGISDRAGSAIGRMWALYQDVGIISESNVLNVVDRNKIRRRRTKARTTLFSQDIKDYGHDQFGLNSMGEKTGLYQWKTTEEKS